MSLIHINRQPSRRQLAVFGLVWLVFFGMLAEGITARGGRPVAMAVWALALIVPAIGWMAPPFMRWVYLAMSYLALPIGLVVSYVVLAAVWYLVFAPIGLCMRLAGYDPLTRHFDRKTQSYWTVRKPPDGTQGYFRQF
jgi:hypothetical protein